MARKLDWCTSWWSEALALAAGGIENIELLGTAELDRYDDDVIVERLIGQYYVSNDSTTQVNHVALRIYDTDFSLTGSIAGQNLWAFDSADARFMWHKILQLDFATSAGRFNMGPYGGIHPEYSHIDLRVSRRLGDMRGLYMTMQSWQDVDFSWGLWLRALIKV